MKSFLQKKKYLQKYLHECYVATFCINVMLSPLSKIRPRNKIRNKTLKRKRHKTKPKLPAVELVL